MSRDGQHSISAELYKNIDFAVQLAKRGKMELLSNQIMLEADDALNLAGITLPEGCEIEYVRAVPTRCDDRPRVSVTFHFPDD